MFFTKKIFNTKLLLKIIGVLLVLKFNGFSETPVLFPSPNEIHLGDGYFEINSKTKIKYVPLAFPAIEYLNKKLKTVAGFELSNNENSFTNIIELVDEPTIDSNDVEAYTLSITPKKIIIGASGREGFFYAIQTLLQLLPPELAAGTPDKNILLRVVSLIIKDKPKYRWRSFMLDSGRQKQSVEFIKRYLEYLAMLKINIFHWHLTEGQGWRIEIDKYPKLTQVGSFVAKGSEQQGFYTKQEISEVVEYAKQLCIKVVPEIDLPGHSEAALIAYPEFTCFQKAPESVMEYSSTLFCAGRESTYQFIEDVLDEVCELFPGDYIHLGGDEAPKDQWDSCPACKSYIEKFGLKNSHELQIHFSSRLANYLKKKNRKVILWGDVIETDGPQLPENIVIYWWNYRKKHDIAYKKAIEKGCEIICGTNYYTYLNFPVTPWSRYKEDRTFDIRNIFLSNPSNLSDPPSLVIGMGSCLWTDWNVKMNMIDQRVFPRILLLADQMWREEIDITFDEYYNSLKYFYPRLKALGINYGPAIKDEVPLDYKWE